MAAFLRERAASPSRFRPPSNRLKAVRSTRLLQPTPMPMTLLRPAAALGLAHVLLASAAAAQQAPPGFDAYVKRVMETFTVPGVAVAIVKDGKVVLAKGYGVRRLGDPAPVDP